MAVRIVTDSTSDLPIELAERHGITVLPCYVIIGDETYQDGVDISADRFYEQLATLPRLPTTSQPTPADFQAVYTDLIGQGDQVVSIHVSGKLSGTLNSANQAKAAIGADAPVEVIDSQLASIPLALAVLDAARLIERGLEFESVAQQVRESLPLHDAYFMLDTLEYLQKGGRIGKAQAFLGSMLSVRPILRLQDGEVDPVERPRNRERARRRLVELVRALAPVRQLALAYSTDPAPAQSAMAELRDLAPEADVVEARFGPILGTYLGPNAVGIAVTRQQD